MFHFDFEDELALFVWIEIIYNANTTVSYWRLTFHYCSNGCFSSIHNVKDPSFMEWIFCLTRKEFVSLDWIKAKGKLELQAVLFHSASLWVWFTTSRGRNYTTDCLHPHAEAKRGLDSHSSHSQQTINPNGSTSSTLPLFSILIALFQTTKTYHMLMHIITPAKKNTTRRAGQPHTSSVLFFMLSLLKAFL